jgi:hypothetical protein
LPAYAALDVEDTLEIPSKSIVTVVSMHITPGDLEPDGDVDIDDFLILTSQWLQPPLVPWADIAPDPLDGIIDLKDFAVFAEHYLE